MPQPPSFGGYFNLLAEELDIPPVPLPYDAASSASRYAAESAIVVCTGCRRGMRLQPGTNMVQVGGDQHGAGGWGPTWCRWVEADGVRRGLAGGGVMGAGLRDYWVSADRHACALQTH